MKLGQTSAVFFLAQVGTSVVGFLAMVYFTHTLAEATLGSYFLVIAVLLWLNVVLGRTVQRAMGKRLSESDDGAYVGAGLAVQAPITLVVVVALVALRSRVNAYVGESVALPLVGLVVVTFAFSFVQEVLKGQRSVHIAGTLQLLDRSARSGIQILAVALGFGLLGLLVGYAAAATIGVAAGILWIRANVSLPSRGHLRSLVGYARYAWLGMLGQRAFASMDTVVLGLFVARPLIAYYEIAWNLASVLGIFGVAISETLFPEISKLDAEGNDERIEVLIEDALAYAGLFLIPGLVGSLLVGGQVLTIYGEAYSRGATVLVVLVFARLVYAYESQLVNALNGIDRPELAFRVNAVFVCANVAGNVALVVAFGWIGAAVSTALSVALALVVAYRYLDGIMGMTLPYVAIGQQIGAAAVMALVVTVLGEYLPGSALGAVIVVATGAATYLIALSGLSPRFRRTILRNLPA